MNEILTKLEPKEWLILNIELQTKKNALRKALKQKGVLKKGATNEFDKYSYFSEAQYKELFTELLSDYHLELKFTELEYTTFEGTEKQANGRMPKLEFSLFDTTTGFFETTVITGEGIDKGDKAGYKAYTGALKYFLANTFMVATGDDPEKDSPDNKMNTKKTTKTTAKPIKATAKQVELINNLVSDIPAMLGYYKVEKMEDLTAQQASEIITKKMKAKKTENISEAEAANYDSEGAK